MRTLLPLDRFIISMRSDKVRRKDCVINEMRFSSPLHESHRSAVIEDFYARAFQHFYARDLTCCRVDVQSEPAATLPVPGESRLVDKLAGAFSRSTVLNRRALV
jgi:hypothetical protein